MKKFLSLLLAAMMILSVMPMTALADGMKSLDLAPIGEVAVPEEELAASGTEEAVLLSSGNEPVVTYDTDKSVTAEKIGTYIGNPVYLASLPYGAQNPQVAGAISFIPEEASDGEAEWMKDAEFDEALSGMGVTVDTGKVLPQKNVKGFAAMVMSESGISLVVVQVSTAAPAEDKTIGVDGIFNIEYKADAEGTVEIVGTCRSPQKKHTGNAYLISLPIGTTISGINAVQSSAILRMFAKKSGIYTSLPPEEEYHEDEDFTKAGPQNIMVLNCVTFNEGFSLPVKNVKGFNAFIKNDADSSYTVLFVQIAVEDESKNIGMDGEGTKENPYIIKTSENLKKISELTETKGENFVNTFFKFSDDIDSITLPEDWTPIGTKNGFSGTIDGNGKLLIVPNGSLSLIGRPQGTRIKNLSIYGEKIPGYGLIEGYTTNCAATLDNITIKSGSHILKSGLVGGYGNLSVNISNCTVEKGVVIGDDGTWGDLGTGTYMYDFVGEVNGQDMIGSIAGAWNGTMTNCVSYATVYGRNYVGGLVGFKGQSMRSLYINDCAFYGDIIATGSYVGGIMGSGYVAKSAGNSPCVIIENCHATGSIKGTDKVGGILGGEGVTCCWGNGIGRVRNNFFAGKVAATADNACIGGVIGYMASMDVYNDIRANYFVEDCGAEKGIGKVEKLYSRDNVTYSEYIGYGRDDAPMTSEEVTKKVTRKQLTNGELVNMLNSGKFGRNDYRQGEAYPVFGNEKHITGITSRSLYDDEVASSVENTVPVALETDGNISRVNSGDMVVKYSDGTEETIKLSAGEFSGVDFSLLQKTQLAKLTYKNYELTFGVQVNKKYTGDISVSIRIMGDSVHGSDGTAHTLKDGNLTEWIPLRTYDDVSNTFTVNRFIGAKSRDLGIYFENSTGNKLDSVTYNNVTLKEGDNGVNSCWRYTINGIPSDLGIAEQYLEDGDVIVLYYTDDAAKDIKDVPYDKIMKVRSIIAAIGEVTLTDESKAKIDAAREAYEKLDDAEKTYVNNYNVLTEAENAYDMLKAKAVEDMIFALQPVTKGSGDAVKAAREAYEALTPEQKELVSKEAYEALVKAEKMYDLIIGSNKPDASDKGDKTGSIIKISDVGAAKGERNPNTGAPAMSVAPAMLVLAAAVLVLKKRG